jgi:hypothetical protein
MDVSRNTARLTQEHPMTNFITQTIARQQVAELIAEAERGRVRREFRKARRAERVARRNERLVARGASNGSEQWPSQIGYAVAR